MEVFQSESVWDNVHESAIVLAPCNNDELPPWRCNNFVDTQCTKWGVLRIPIVPSVTSDGQFERMELYVNAKARLIDYHLQIMGFEDSQLAVNGQSETNPTTTVETICDVIESSTTVEERFSTDWIDEEDRIEGTIEQIRLSQNPTLHSSHSEKSQYSALE